MTQIVVRNTVSFSLPTVISDPGLPLASVVPWAVVTELSYPDRACWEGYARHSAVWFLIAPRLVAVLVSYRFKFVVA